MSPPTAAEDAANLLWIEVEDVRSNPHHDQLGRFSSADGVRASLATAASVGEVDSVLRGELKSITGRDVDVNQAGSDLQIAREHAEGILRVAERFPDARLHRVATYGPGGSSQLHPPDTSQYALTGKGTSSSAIYFNTHYAGNADRYRQAMENDVNVGWHPKSGHSAVGTGAHEMVHVVANGRPKAESAARATAQTAAKQAGASTVKQHVGRSIGGYATTNKAELAAEAVSDVILRGKAASPLSHDIFDQFDRAQT